MATGESLLQTISDLASERLEDLPPSGGEFQVRVLGEFARDMRMRAIGQYRQYNPVERLQQNVPEVVDPAFRLRGMFRERHAGRQGDRSL